MALDGGPDGLDFYRRIAREAPAHLNAGGFILMETGWDQAEAVCALLKENGFTHTAAHEDFRGILRFAEGRL